MQRSRILAGIALAALIAVGPTWLRAGKLRFSAPEMQVEPRPGFGEYDFKADATAAGVLDEPLPPLDEELMLHGGSYLYEPDDCKPPGPHAHCHDHAQFLRLPEWWQQPLPLTHFQEFLGADPIHPRPGLQWFGEDGFQWEPRFVGHGGYEIFGIALEEGGRRHDGIGHQLLVDLDLRVTGTERAHVQFRPLGRKNSGGSFYQFSDPAGYQDNSTLIPQRWWIEGEFFSVFGGLLDDPFTPRDYHFVAGKFPFALHNNLLINDEVTGFALNKNTIIGGPISNLNVQLFYALDDVDAYRDAGADLWGVNVFADVRRVFLEGTFASVHHNHDADRNAVYGAFSATKLYGPLTVAGRMLFKGDDDRGRGDGQLYVVESNYTRSFCERFYCLTGFEYGVFYANAFKATSGWNSISGGNFNRLRTSFELDPLIRLSAAAAPDNTIGGSMGVQLFRHHDDESLIPEVAYEEPAGESVWGASLRYLRKLGPRTYLEAVGIINASSDDRFDREGVFVSTFIIF